MTILSLIQAVLSLANTLMGYAKDRQLMDAGEAKSVAKGLQEAMDAIDRARRARAAVDPAGVPDDPHNRDRDTMSGP